MATLLKGLRGKPVRVRYEPVAVFGDEIRERPLPAAWY